MTPPHAARWALALAVLLSLAGCGIRPTGIIGAGDPPMVSGDASTVTVYLVEGVRLRAVTRNGLPGRPYLAVEQLAVPPTESERARRLRTEVRRSLEAYTVTDVAATQEARSTLVVLPLADQRGSWPAWSRMAVAQIACTARAIPGIERVNLWHAPNAGKDGWGVVSCSQFTDLIA